MKRRYFIQAMAGAAVSLAAIRSGAVLAQPGCSLIYVRRECRDLPSLGWSNFVAAVKRMNRPVLPHLQKTPYDDFCQKYSILLTCGDLLAPTSMYRVRKLLLEFESRLRRVDSSISLPYWNFSIDAPAPEQSVVLSSAFVGGNGRGVDSLVEDGPFAGWSVGYPDSPGIAPVRHILSRQFDQRDRISGFHSPQAISSILLHSQTIADLSTQLQPVVAKVFAGVGGDINTDFAPNDPLFWLVACYIDKLLGDWLQMHPEATQPDPVCYQYA